MPNALRASVLPGTHAVPEVAMGYCFLTKDGSDTSLTVLVLEDRNFRAILSAPCPARRPPARGHGGPSGAQHPQAGAPPQ
eukprot:7388516-Alexandrium_andersonii.AAC.1